jgi:DNA-binding transcriptional ArsR family regulator
MAKRSLPSAAATETIGGQALRYSIVSVLDTRVETTASALAAELEVSVARVRRQLRVLSRAGLVETVTETARRGVTERSYRLAGDLIIDDEEFDALPVEQKERIVRSILRVSLGDILRSVKAGLINRRSDRCVVRAPVLVDEEGWRELARIHGRTYEEVRRVREESERRLKDSDGDPIATVSIQLFIELP